MSYSSLGYWGSDEGYYDWPDLSGSSVYKKFAQNNWEWDEVYVFRFEVSGLPSEITSTSQAYPLVRAYIDAQDSGNLNQDVRGICLRPLGSGRYVVEIIITHAPGFHNGVRTTEKIMSGMTSSLSEAGYSGSIRNGNFYFIENNPEVLQKWSSQPAIWAWRTYTGSGEGSRAKGFTQTYLDGKGVWLNSSAISQQHMLRPPPPVIIEPPAPPPDVIKPKYAPPNTVPREDVGVTTSAGGVDSTAILIVGAAIAAAYFFTRKRARS